MQVRQQRLKHQNGMSQMFNLDFSAFRNLYATKYSEFIFAEDFSVQRKDRNWKMPQLTYKI